MERAGASQIAIGFPCDYGVCWMPLIKTFGSSNPSRQGTIASGARSLLPKIRRALLLTSAAKLRHPAFARSKIAR